MRTNNVEKKRGRPKGSKNKVKVTEVKVAKKRGRPKGSKNKVSATAVAKTKAPGKTSERFEKIHFVEDMFYSEDVTEVAREKFLGRYPDEGKYFKKEWGKLAAEVAQKIYGL